EGVTRDSLLTVARDLGYEAEEGRISVDQWQRDAQDGALTEVFACGTAAVITPVGTVKRAGAEWQQGGGEPGEVTMRLRRALLDIQRGTAEDTHGWMHTLA
ncbi:branched chain amino acid aminotransferase, partial [Streptomyces sp. TRM76130]|nr:branched chain amino acid aminotransferase [Streptomyces sp. TRM76130]